MGSNSGGFVVFSRAIVGRLSGSLRLGLLAPLVLIYALSCSPAPYGENPALPSTDPDMGQGPDVAVDDAMEIGPGDPGDVSEPPDLPDAHEGADVVAPEDADTEADLAPDDVDDACEPNPCGGCDGLESEPGGPCGTCGSGEWICDSPERLVCSGDGGDEALNTCGGCAPLEGTPDTPCGTCQRGRWVCDAPDRISC